MGTEKDDEMDDELVAVEKPSKDKTLTDNDDDDDESNDSQSAAEDNEAEGRPSRESESDVDDETIEQRRERRRAERHARKARREEWSRRDRLEMEFLRKRNEDLERRFSSVEQTLVKRSSADVDAQINQAVNDFRASEKIIEKALAAGQGGDVVQAMRYRDEARAKIDALNRHKQESEFRHLQAQQQPEMPPPRVMSQAQQFIKEHDWYDPNGRDEDSSIVLAIDNTLVQEGYDPNTKEYWDELRSRVKRRIPEKFRTTESRRDHDEEEDRQADTRRPRGGPSVSAGRERSAQPTRREVYISPERKQALMDLGAWDDPVLRAKYVKRFAEYDKRARSDI